MSWFDTVDNPEDISVLPPAFAKAKRLWEEDAENNFETIQGLLGHYVQGLFLTEAISGAEQLFPEPFAEPEALMAPTPVLGPHPLPRLYLTESLLIECRENAA